MVDMDTKEIVNSYMDALYELADDNKTNLDDLKKDLNVFSEMFQTIAGDDFNTLLCINKKSFDSLICTLKENDKISDLSYRFAKVLNRNHSFSIMVSIIDGWDVFVLQKQGYKELELITSIPLEKKELEILKEQIAGIVKDKIYVTHKVRPSIIGGIVVKYNDFLFDDSILWKLNNLENTMKGNM